MALTSVTATGFGKPSPRAGSIIAGWRVAGRLALLLMLLHACALAWAQGVSISVTPDRIRPGETARVVIDVNLQVAPPNRPPNYRAGEEPIFETNTLFPAGTPPGGITGNGAAAPDAEWIYGNRFRVVPRQREDGTWRATGRIEMTFQAADRAKAGEVILTVRGVSGMTNPLSGGAAGRADAQRRLVLLAGSGGAGLGGTVNRPPLPPTGGSSNPTGEILGWVAGIATLLGTLAGVARVARRKPQPRPATDGSTAARAPSDPPPFGGPEGPPHREAQPLEPRPIDLELPPAVPTTVPEENLQVVPRTWTRARPPVNRPPDVPGAGPEDLPPLPPPPKRPPRAGCRVDAFRRPSPRVSVKEGDATRTYDYRGDGQCEIEVAVVATPAPEWTVLQVGFDPDVQPAGPFERGWMVEESERAAWYDISGLPPGTAVQYFRLAVPWQWDDRDIELNAPLVSVYLTHGTGLATRHGPVQPLWNAGDAHVRLQGADPRARVTPDRTSLLATGRDAVSLAVKVLLFGEAADGEKATITAITGLDGDPRPAEQQVHEGRWTAPFLVRRPDVVETVALHLTVRWKSGPQFKRAHDARKRQPLRTEPIDVSLRGCTAELMRSAGSAESLQPAGSGGPSGALGTSDAPPPVDLRALYPGRYFCPYPGQPILMAARLLDADGNPVPDPCAADAVHAIGAGFRCEVRDLSQAPVPPRQAHRCKLPPRSPLMAPAGPPVPRSAAEVDAAINHAQVVASPTLAVDAEGHFQLAQQAPKATPDVAPWRPFSVWSYALRDECEPIDGAPVVYTLVLTDGLGGILRLRGLTQARLGQLILETGGPDFRIHEHLPFRFSARYQHPLGFAPLGSVRVTWSFAQVDADGEPLATADPAAPVMLEQSASGQGDPFAPFELIVGHMPPYRDTWLYCVDGAPRDGEVRACDVGLADPMRQETQGPGWRSVEPHRTVSATLRHAWHALWLTLSAAEREACSERALRALSEVDATPWRDAVLPMAVRLEMHDAHGRLIATSDRQAPASLAGGEAGWEYTGRTPAPRVWRDHRFGYVLLALRLRLRETDEVAGSGPYVGRPYAVAPYRLSFDGTAQPDARTGEHGEIEVVVPCGPRGDVEHISVELLNRAGEPNGAAFDVRLGALDPIEDIGGVEARLNNLGLFASADVQRCDDARLRRAVQRFQYLTHHHPDSAQMEYAGDVADIRDWLAEAHDMTGVVQRRRSAPDRNAYGIHRTPSVAQMSRPVSEAERLRPAPPALLRRREVRAATAWPGTLRVPGDPEAFRTAGRPAQKDYWFPVGGDPPMGKPWPDNEVLTMVDGPAVFAEMARTMRLANGPDDFIFLLGWFLGMDFELIPGDPESTADALFGAAAGRYRVNQDELQRARDAIDDAQVRHDENLQMVRIEAGRWARLDAAERGDLNLRAVRAASTAQALVDALQAIEQSARHHMLDPGASDATAPAGGPPGDAAGDRGERRYAGIAQVLQKAVLLSQLAGALAHLRSALRALQALVSRPPSPDDPPPSPLHPLPPPPTEFGQSAVDSAHQHTRAAEDALTPPIIGDPQFQPIADAVLRAAWAIDRTVVEPEPNRDVQVRAMLWANLVIPAQNRDEVARINALLNGAAVHDGLTESIAGSHHQKVLIVHHDGELTAFCGGVDINPDRAWAQEPGTPNAKGDTRGAPFHDVHCRIRGPAAADLLKVFVQRWTHHPRAAVLDGMKGKLRSPRLRPGNPAPSGRQIVQIGRTFGMPKIHKLDDQRPDQQGPTLPYDFAPQGERTAWALVRQAIRRSRRFIYLEDQYLTSEWARDELLDRLRRDPPLEHVTILIPPDEFTVMDIFDTFKPRLNVIRTGTNTAALRHRFLDRLLAEFPDRVRVFVLQQDATAADGVNPARPADWHTYVHNKMWIVDDEFLVLGSANCGMRSYSNDTEVMAGVTDEPTSDWCSYHLAHQLRIAIWAELLNMDTAEGHAELTDGVASAVHWVLPPAGARVQRYRPFIGELLPSKTPDFLIEPEGAGSNKLPP